MLSRKSVGGLHTFALYLSRRTRSRWPGQGFTLSHTHISPRSVAFTTCHNTSLTSLILDGFQLELFETLRAFIHSLSIHAKTPVEDTDSSNKAATKYKASKKLLKAPQIKISHILSPSVLLSIPSIALRRTQPTHNSSPSPKAHPTSRCVGTHKNSTGADI